MRPFRNFLLSAFIISALAACQTNELRQIRRVKTGMDKQDVMDIMGTPRRTERVHGMDRWTYVFYAEDKWQSKEVRFLEGEVTYVGDPMQPAISADEIDKKNEKSNEELAQQLAKDHKERKEFLDKWEPQDEPDKIKYVPEYKPLN